MIDTNKGLLALIVQKYILKIEIDVVHFKTPIMLAGFRCRSGSRLVI